MLHGYRKHFQMLIPISEERLCLRHIQVNAFIIQNSFTNYKTFTEGTE